MRCDTQIAVSKVNAGKKDTHTHTHTHVCTSSGIAKWNYLRNWRGASRRRTTTEPRTARWRGKVPSGGRKSQSTEASIRSYSCPCLSSWTCPSGGGWPGVAGDRARPICRRGRGRRGRKRRRWSPEDRNASPTNYRSNLKNEWLLQQTIWMNPTA